MGNSLELYRTILTLLVKTIPPSLSVWPSIQSRARYAACCYRRLQRWLRNDKVNPQAIYGPLITQHRSVEA